MKTIIIALLTLTIQSYSQYKVEWSATHTSEGPMSIDKAQYIATDSEGNVIISGVTNGDGLGDNITTIKYNKDGNPLWTNVYNGPGNFNDRPNGIAIDQFNNIFVTGGSTGDNGTSTDMITIKYNPAGTEQWAARYASRGGILDEAKSIGVDQLGNVYVTGFAGHIVANNSGLDWVTIKYNTNGEQIWIAAYDDGLTSDRALALTVDEKGNVYVSGQCNAPGYHLATIKYDSSGNRQWVSKYNQSGKTMDEATDIKVDKQGYVYVIGHGYGNTSDYITILYDNNGNEVWAKNYNGLANLKDEAFKILVDKNGNSYVLGVSGVKKNHLNRCIVKYASTGELKWNITAEQTLSKNIGQLSMIFDSDENILVIGSSKVLNDKEPTEMVVDCYNKDGALQWQTLYTSPNKIPVASALATDNLGNIYVTGYVMGTKGFFDYCTVKFSK